MSFRLFVCSFFGTMCNIIEYTSIIITTIILVPKKVDLDALVVDVVVARVICVSPVLIESFRNNRQELRSKGSTKVKLFLLL